MAERRKNTKHMRFFPYVPTGVVMAAASLAVAAPGLKAQALQTGIISGTIAVSGGQSAKGVQVRILDTGQTTATDERGFFVITSVLPGSHSVEASLVGYEAAVEDGVSVTQELTTTVNLTLERQKAQSFGESVVRIPMIRKDNPSTVYTVTAEQEQLVRGTPDNLYQYPGAAISQPGVVPDPNGFPSIRGGRQFNTGYMLDGILLTQPSSGQFASNLVTVGMGRMNVYTGGMRADLGGATAGFINSVIKTGASVRGGSIETSAGSLLFGNVVAEAGNVERSGLNWYAATNMWRTDVKGNAGYDEIPASADAIVKVIKPLGEKTRLSLLATQGYERYEVPAIDPFTGEPLPTQFTLEIDDSRLPRDINSPTNPWVTTRPTQSYLNQQHAIGSLTLAHSFSPGSTLSAQVYGWNRKKAINALSPIPQIDDKDDDRLLAGAVDYVGQISDRFQLRLGGNVIQGDNFNRRARYGIPNPESGPPVGPPNGYLRIRAADTTDAEAYVAVTAKPAPSLTADVGVRFGSRTYHRNITPEEIAMGNPAIAGEDQKVLKETGQDPRYNAVSPRLGLTYAADRNTAFKFAAGRYAQFSPSNYIENQFLPITKANGSGNPNGYLKSSRKVFDVGPEHANAFEFGVERQFTDNLAVSLTPYWRTIDDMIARDPMQPGNPFTNEGHGHVRGVETKLTMREHNGWSGWLTYTYQKAKANVTAQSTDQTLADPVNRGGEFRMDYDQRHTVYLVGRYRKDRFEINPMLELGSGYPYGLPGSGDSGPGYDYDDFGDEYPVLVNGHVQSGGINDLQTGWHKYLSVTFRLYADDKKSSYYFLQVQNLLNSDDVLVRSRFNPFTGDAGYGFVQGAPGATYTDENGVTKDDKGHFEYRPAVRVPPVFVLVGVRKVF